MAGLHTQRRSLIDNLSALRCDIFATQCFIFIENSQWCLFGFGCWNVLVLICISRCTSVFCIYKFFESRRYTALICAMLGTTPNHSSFPFAWWHRLKLLFSSLWWTAISDKWRVQVSVCNRCSICCVVNRQGDTGSAHVAARIPVSIYNFFTAHHCTILHLTVQQWGV